MLVTEEVWVHTERMSQIPLLCIFETAKQLVMSCQDRALPHLLARRSKLKLFCGALIPVDALIALWICFISIHTQAFVTNGVLLLCCREKLSISKSIDDMVAYTQLTDHVYYQILCSDDAGLEEVISADKYYQNLLGYQSIVLSAL